MFKEEPVIIFTDGDQAMAAALVMEFSCAVTHLLCTWHLSRNVAAHFKMFFTSCFGKTGNIEWQRFFSAFWTLALDSDVRRRLSFDNDFSVLFSILLGGKSKVG